MFAIILLSVGAPPSDLEIEKAKAAVAVAVAVANLNEQASPVPVVVAPASPDRFTATDGVTYERGADGYYRAVSGAPAVASPKPFCTGDYNPSHRCNACGYQSPSGTGTWIVRGRNADGTHTHQCERCGNSWRH